MIRPRDRFVHVAKLLALASTNACAGSHRANTEDPSHARDPHPSTSTASATPDDPMPCDSSAAPAASSCTPGRYCTRAPEEGRDGIHCACMRRADDRAATWQCEPVLASVPTDACTTGATRSVLVQRDVVIGYRCFCAGAAGQPRWHCEPPPPGGPLPPPDLFG